MTAIAGGPAASSAPHDTRRRVIVFALLALLLPLIAVVTSATHAQAATLLSQGKPTTASSAENASFPAPMATDGNTGTRWASAFSDPQWIQVDLGSSQSISQVVLNWEAAYGKSFQIQTSPDAATWTSIYSTTTGTGGVQTLNVSGAGRYVRMYGTVRGTAYGYSLWEFQVFGGATPPPTCGTTNIAQGKAATSSGNENAGSTPDLAVDGNAGTRWSSTFADPSWIQVDLGSTQSICSVVLNWEAAYGKAFQIQTAAAAAGPWTTVYSTTTGAGGVQTLAVSGSGRYVRMYGTARATQYGYSLWEFGVYALTSGTPTSTPSTTPSGGSYGGFAASFWGDTSVIPAAKNVLELQILNRTNGAY
ncbi:MAG: hypothetical protein QOK14_466, partial [Frankiaceae bacterium]|nr:hypothetical protein [Frankiaceae bacterium]